MKLVIRVAQIADSGGPGRDELSCKREIGGVSDEMALAFASSFSMASGKRSCTWKMKPLTPSLQLSTQKKFSCSATVTMDRTTQASEYELESKKHNLLSIVQDTQRGLVTTADQRSIIEEALVDLEGYNMGEPIDLAKLDGTWRLQYTSAPDVLVLFEAAARLPFFQVGQIFQKFECQDQSDRGVIRNVVRWSIPTVLEDQEGATLVVSAKFNVVSARNVYLQFEEITVQNINISEELQALIAPALLPRTFLSLQILQFIRSFKAQVPVTATNPNPLRRSVAGLYYLSYLDRNMLLGRSVGGGGIFVFTKAQPLEL